VRPSTGADGLPAAGGASAPAGPAERDAAWRPLGPEELEAERGRAVSGRIVSAVAEEPGRGVLASGVLQRVDDVAEVAGVGTLPTERRRGLGAAVTAALTGHALDSGADLVLLSAASDDVARLYARLGFRRVGTACIAEPAAVVL
jgi:ribosomal protein S18 acetylase RimI-like enzyme